MEFSMNDSPSIQALGSLFKLTEVHFLDDGFTESSFVSEPINYTNRDLEKKRDSVELSGSRSLPVDLELAEKMNDLGLPLSFRTNKERRYGTSSAKRKGLRESNQQSSIGSRNHMLDSIEASEETTKASISIINSTSIIVDPHATVTDIDSLSNLSIERVDSLSSTACTDALVNEVYSKCEVSDLEFRHSMVDNSTREKSKFDAFRSTNESLCPDDGSCVTSEDANTYDRIEIKEEIKSSAMEHDTEGQSEDVSFVDTKQNVVSDMNENHQSQQEDWAAYWDDFHMRTYFYNVKTEESTWDPPTGMEHLVFGNFENIADDSANVSNDLAEMNNEQFDSINSYEVCTTDEIIYDEGSTSQQFGEDTGNYVFADNGSSNATKRKKKVKRTKSNKEVSVSIEDMQGVLQEVTPSISKYWWQRYILFSKFDCGIRMDEEGWFSVTPESIAKHHAARCGTGSIIDFFTGVGGNAIQFAQRSKHVIAIDIDPNKIEFARHNAAIYGVEDNIDFIKGDSFSLAPKLKANTVFMSPPWGGPDYSKVKKFDVNMLRPCDGQSLFNVGKKIAPEIIMFLPRNVDINQLAEIALSAFPPWSLEVEKNVMNGRLKSVTAYFADPSKSSQHKHIGEDLGLNV